MPIYNPQKGVFRGTQLIQKRGTIGGYKNVFVALQGEKNELIFPTFGAAIANPFKGAAKLFAGDLAEYRTDSGGKNPKYFILKTFKVVSGSGTTVNILKDDYKHIPFVGDCLMVAPDVIGGSGTAVKVTAVNVTTVTVSEVTYPVWQLTLSATLGTLAKDTILVESEDVAAAETSETKQMMVHAINSVCDSDYDMLEKPSLTYGQDGDTNFDDARYHVSFALGGLMYTEKMSPMPQCVIDLNRSNVNGWYKVDYYDMRAIQDTATVINEINNAVSGITPLSGASDPTTSTVGAVGQIYHNTTDDGMFMCVKVTGTTSKTYTWKEITFVA